MVSDLPEEKKHNPMHCSLPMSLEVCVCKEGIDVSKYSWVFHFSLWTYFRDTKLYAYRAQAGKKKS